MVKIKVPEPVACHQVDQAAVQVRRTHTPQLHPTFFSHLLGSVHRLMPLLRSMIMEADMDQRPLPTHRLLLHLTSQRQVILPHACGILPLRHLIPSFPLVSIIAFADSS